MTAPPAGVVWDARWEVTSGIGRFSREVRQRLEVPVLAVGKAPPTTVRGIVDLERAALAERRRETPRALLCPGFMGPVGWPGPTAVVIHDLMHRTVPGEAGRVRRTYLDTVVRHSARHAAVVLTVSEHSKKELVAWAEVPADRVVVVGNGVSPAFTPEGPRLDLGHPYLLYVGNHKPHKNLPRMVEAFAELGESVHLVMSGEPTDQLRDLARLHGVSDRVTHLGSADDDELAAAYRGATATLVLSTHEGFGFPALESMACGTPVVASRAPALVEVLGPVGAYADAADPDDMARTMEAVLGDAELARRLSAEGPARAAGWSWTRVAHRVARALDDALGTTIARDRPKDWRP